MIALVKKPACKVKVCFFSVKNQIKWAYKYSTKHGMAYQEHRASQPWDLPGRELEDAP